MKREEMPSETKAIIKGLRKVIKGFEEGEVETIVCFALSKDGDYDQQFVLGIEEHKFEAIGCLEIMKRDILEQVPKVGQGELK
jgi:hypothetical protein